MARSLAAIELLPYHSKSGVVSSAKLAKFASVEWAKSHVAEVLSTGNVDVIAMRQVRLWDPQNAFSGNPRWCAYESGQSMAASLKPGHGNGGGDRIVNAVVAAVMASR